MVTRLRAVPFSPMLDNQGFLGRLDPGLALIKNLQTLGICITYEYDKGPTRRKQLKGCPSRTGACRLGHLQCAPGELDGQTENSNRRGAERAPPETSGRKCQGRDGAGRMQSRSLNNEGENVAFQRCEIRPLAVS